MILLMTDLSWDGFCKCLWLISKIFSRLSPNLSWEFGDREGDKRSSDNLNFSFSANMNRDSEDDKRDKEHVLGGQATVGTVHEVPGYKGET